MFCLTSRNMIDKTMCQVLWRNIFDFYVNLRVEVGKHPQVILAMYLYPRSPKREGGILFYLCPSVQDIFCRIFLSNCWWQKSDIWSQVFLDPSDSYFLFAEERGYHKWALAHSSSCFILYKNNEHPDWMIDLKHTDSTWFSKVTQVNSL